MPRAAPRCSAVLSKGAATGSCPPRLPTAPSCPLAATVWLPPQGPGTATSPEDHGRPQSGIAALRHCGIASLRSLLPASCAFTGPCPAPGNHAQTGFVHGGGAGGSPASPRRPAPSVRGFAAPLLPRSALQRRALRRAFQTVPGMRSTLCGKCELGGAPAAQIAEMWAASSKVGPGFLHRPAHARRLFRCVCPCAVARRAGCLYSWRFW